MKEVSFAGGSHCLESFPMPVKDIVSVIAFTQNIMVWHFNNAIYTVCFQRTAITWPSLKRHKTIAIIQAKPVPRTHPYEPLLVLNDTCYIAFRKSIALIKMVYPSDIIRCQGNSYRKEDTGYNGKDSFHQSLSGVILYKSKIFLASNQTCKYIFLPFPYNFLLIRVL